MPQIKLNYGFTLLELLIAVSLSSIVMVVLVGGFYMVSKNWQLQEQRLDKAIDNSLIRIEIEKAILGAFPYTYKKESNEVVIYFKGDEHQLQFVSTMSPSYNNQLTIWSLIAKNKGGLSIQVSSALTGDPDEILAKLSSSNKSENEATSVLEDYQIEFEYLKDNESKQNNEKLWLTKWDASQSKLLPTAVRIQLSLINEDENKKNDEIIAFILANKHQSIQVSQQQNPFADAISAPNINPFSIK